MIAYLLFAGSILFVLAVLYYCQNRELVRETLDTWRWIWKERQRARRAWRRRK